MPARGLNLAVAALAAILQGCAGNPATVEVKVPVPVPCSPPAVEKPSFPVDSLTGTENVFIVARALWATVALHEGYEGKLEAAVAACR